MNNQTIKGIKDRTTLTGPTQTRENVVLDRDGLLAILGRNLAVLPELVESFCEETSHLLTKLSQAIDRRNVSEAKRVAHTLRGSAGLMHGPGAYEAARNLEFLACSGDLTGAEEVFLQLEEEMSRLTSALAQLAESTAHSLFCG